MITATLDDEAITADPDVDLMLRVRGGEAGAFEELVERHRQRLFSRFFRAFQDRQEAEDLTQEVFLRLYRSRKRYQPRAKFSTWLYHIAQNVARNALRTRRRHACLRLSNVENAEASSFERTALASPMMPLELSELAGVVRTALSGLMARQRTALEMQQFQNCSYAEIADALALTPEAAKSLLYRARLQLRDFLASFVET